MGHELQWYNPVENTQCRVYVRKRADFNNEVDWTAQQLWLKETLEKFQSVFVPIIKRIEHSVFKN